MPNNLKFPERKTHKEFVSQVKEKYGDEYSVIGKYINNRTCIKLRHNKCGNIWETTRPVDFLKERPNTCPICAHPSRRKTNEEFLYEVEKLVGGKYTFLDKYTTNKTKMRVRHNLCDFIYTVTPNNFLGHKGTRCPKCVAKKLESKGTRKIKKFLKKNNIDFIQEKKIKDKYTTRMDKCLKFDFYIKSLKLAIEFDGEQHFKPKRGGEEEFKKTLIRDKRKNEFCERKNINIIRLSFKDERKIKSILRKEFKKYGIELV